MDSGVPEQTRMSASDPNILAVSSSHFDRQPSDLKMRPDPCPYLIRRSPMQITLLSVTGTLSSETGIQGILEHLYRSYTASQTGYLDRGWPTF